MAKSSTMRKPASKKPDRRTTPNSERRVYKKVITLTPVTVAPASRSPYKPEYVEQVRKLCQLGATDRDIADFFEVTTQTIWNWQAQHPDFSAALKRGKEASHDRVERSLYARATGYTFDSVKILSSKDGEPTLVPILEHVPPDVTACIFWLKNRRPAEWRDKTDHEHTHAHRLQLQGGAMSVEEAQNLFRQARSMTPAELERSLKIVDGTVVSK